MGIEACFNCTNAVWSLERSYTQKDMSYSVFDADHPAKPGTKGDFKTSMFVVTGCLGGKVEGQGETREDSLRSALANSEIWISQNCPLKTQ